MSDSPLKRTMRIDLSPSTAIAAPEAEGPPPVRKPPEPEIFVPRREERENRDTPYDKLLSSIYDAVLITDFDAHILDFNDRALEFFRADEKALPGVSAIDLISGADKSLLAAIGRNLVARKYTVIEALCTRFDGTSFPAEIAVNRIDLDAQGQLCFLVRDITVRHKAQQDLQNALERVQALDRAHLEFVSNVSHELRTPLTSMIYAVKNMQRGIAGPLPDRAVQYLARLESDCNRLLGTVNDILDLRQIENNTLTLMKSRVPLPRLVEDALASIRVQTDEKRLTVTLRRTRRAGFVLCDVHKRERVVLNIVGKSVKYTPSGGAIDVEISDPSDGRIAFSISDTGIGIPAEALPKVTRRYFRVGDEPNGTGLGLAITREIVELHKGTLSIESPVPGSEKGTRVTVSLPLTPAPTLLAVSSASAFQPFIRDVCEALGLEVAIHESGHKAIQECHRAPPDMVVFGESTSDLNACDLVMQLRNDRRTSRLPLLFLGCGPCPPNVKLALRAFHIPCGSVTDGGDAIASMILSAFLAPAGLKSV
jgi:PAS domain S-box-containing protein